MKLSPSLSLTGLIIILALLACDTPNIHEEFFRTNQRKDFSSFNRISIDFARGYYRVIYWEYDGTYFLIDVKSHARDPQIAILESSPGFGTFQNELNMSHDETVEMVTELFREFYQLGIVGLYGSLNGHFYRFILSDGCELFNIPNPAVLDSMDLAHTSCDSTDVRTVYDEHWVSCGCSGR